jgi:hypothetical protein
MQRNDPLWISPFYQSTGKIWALRLTSLELRILKARDYRCSKAHCTTRYSTIRGSLAVARFG